MSEKIWSDEAWEDYLYWQLQDKKILKRINQLVKDIERNGCMDGIGKPEPLSGDLQGEFSRRIDDKNRLVYHMEEDRMPNCHLKSDLLWNDSNRSSGGGTSGRRKNDYLRC